MKKTLALLSLVIVFICATPVLAADTSDAEWYGIVQITNNSTAATNVMVPFTANTSVFIGQNYMETSGNNTAIVTSSGSDVAFMPAPTDVNTSWIVEVPSIDANNVLTDTLYMGGSTNMSAKLRYFPGSDGFTIGDNASYEIGDNGTLGVHSFVDTDSAETKHIAYKQGAFNLGVSSNTSGTLNAEILTSGYVNLIPNANGDYTNITLVNPGGTPHWQTVDDDPAAPDDAVSYVGVNADAVQKKDAYELTSPAFAGEVRHINAIYVIYRTFEGAAATGKAQPFLRLSATETNGTEVDMNGVWTTGNQTLTRPGGGDWALSDFESLQVAIGVRDDAAADVARCTQVYVQINYDYVQTAVNLTSVSTSEYGVVYSKSPVFLGIGASSSRGTPTFPSVTDNLSFNLPLWSSYLSDTTITSVDANSLSGTVTDAVWSNQGRTFDGTDYITFSDDPSLILTNNITVWAWVYVTNTGDRSEIAAKNGAWSLQADDGGKYRCYCYGLANPGWHNIGNWSLSTWTMVGFSYNGTDVSGIVNGVKSNIATTSGNITITGNDLLIGEGLVLEYFEGTIGEVHIHDIDLTGAEILQLFTDTSWKYTGAHTADYFEYIYSTDSVPNNTNDIQWFLNGSSLYVETANITVDGTLSLDYNFAVAPTGSTWADETASITGNATYRTTSTDADVSAVLLSFLPVSEATAPAYALTDAPDYVTAAINTTGTFVTGVNASYPGAAIVEDVTTAGSTPIQLTTLIIAAVIILGISFLISYFMRKNQASSLLVKLAILTIGVGVLVAVTILDNWVLYIFLILGVAIVMGSTNRQFEGTGITSNNLLGFLVMSFIGMTLVNRILEGRLLTTAERDVMNNITVFQPWHIFGPFTLPVPNVEFLTTGLPALMAWDYSYFGGNAQILQYMFYSITAVISMILLMVALGAVANIFTRLR